MSDENIIRKTVAFPVELAEVIAEEARAERRKFSPHVVKKLEDIFARSTVIQSEEQP